MNQKDSALSLLSRGLSQAETSRALGVSEAYISQLTADEEFSTALAKAKATRITDKSTMDDTYDSIEKTTITKLKEIVEKRGNLLSPEQLLKIGQFANMAKRRNETNENLANPTNAVTVTIVLPSGHVPGLSLTKSATNEVLEVGGRSLLPMASKTLLNLENI